MHSDRLALPLPSLLTCHPSAVRTRGNPFLCHLRTMTQAPPSRLGFFALFGASGIFVVVCIFLSDSLHHSAQAARTDQWRRTAQGWERISSWNVLRASPNAEKSPNASSKWRSDSHPAALALLQIALIALGYYKFPPTRPTTKDAASWRTTLRNSFRASMFG